MGKGFVNHWHWISLLSNLFIRNSRKEGKVKVCPMIPSSFCYFLLFVFVLMFHNDSYECWTLNKLIVNLPLLDFSSYLTSINFRSIIDNRITSQDK